MVSMAGGPILQGDIEALNQAMLQQAQSGPDQFSFRSIARISVPRFRQVIVNFNQPSNILPTIEADNRRAALLLSNLGGSNIFIDIQPVIAINLGYPLAATKDMSIIGYQGPIYCLGAVNNLLLGIVELFNT